MIQMYILIKYFFCTLALLSMDIAHGTHHIMRLDECFVRNKLI